MEVKKTIKNILNVAFSNCSTIISGIIVGFIIPKLLSVEGFGYYKTFTLYVTYLGLFSLGMIDGIVLKYGGLDYEKIDRPLFRCFFKWYTIINGVFAVLLVIFGMINNNGNLRFIFVMLGINLLAVNISGYFQQISQITMRFKEYSWRRVLQSICNIIAVGIVAGIFFFSGKVGYEIYVILLVFINIGLTIWYVITYKDLVFGKALQFKTEKEDVILLIKNGMPLLIANLCSTLIITLDRQFVNILFDTETYAVYAFAYSMLALVTVAISAISTVLYPILKRMDKATLINNYSICVSIILALVFGCSIVYFPLCAFIKWFLPHYMDSLQIFRVIFPGLAISSSITIVMHNYYKTFEQSFQYFKKSVIVLLVSGITNTIAYLIFRTTISISAASILTMLLWYLFAEQYFVKIIGYERKKNLLYLLLLLIVFYLVTAINNDVVACLIYIIAYGSITLVFFKKEIRKLMIGIKNR